MPNATSEVEHRDDGRTSAHTQIEQPQFTGKLAMAEQIEEYELDLWHIDAEVVRQIRIEKVSIRVVTLGERLVIRGEAAPAAGDLLDAGGVAAQELATRFDAALDIRHLVEQHAELRGFDEWREPRAPPRRNQCLERIQQPRCRVHVLLPVSGFALQRAT